MYVYVYIYVCVCVYACVYAYVIVFIMIAIVVIAWLSHCCSRCHYPQHHHHHHPHHHHHHHSFLTSSGMGPSQRKVILAPIVMLPSAGAAGFKAVVPGHGAAPPLGSGTLRDLAPDARDNMAIDIMDTLDRRHQEEEHFKLFCMFHGSGLCQSTQAQVQHDLSRSTQA